MIDEVKKQQIKIDIVDSVNERGVISYLDLITYLETCGYNTTDIEKSISELVQANEIKRLEYQLPPDKSFKTFYMIADARLVI